MCSPFDRVKESVEITYVRRPIFDIVFFIFPLLFSLVTNVMPIYLTAVLRIFSSHLTLAVHYMLVDKDNYNEKISHKQILRESKDFLVGPILHMYAQLALQLIFPGMFFTDSDSIAGAAVATLLVHIVIVEPLYYVVHRWLHISENMKSMHGFHHASISTVPTSSLVQNFREHFIYIATFGPAMILPYFILGYQHWMVIAAYLIIFDLVNAYGHTNIRIRHWIFHHKYSPIKYLFYTPEFHLGHHALFNCNFGLFMPIWDYVFGTAREYQKAALPQRPLEQQDFVFIGHNGGLGHLLTIPEISFYNIYNSFYRTYFPLEVELALMKCLQLIWRTFSSSYSISRYLAGDKIVGRVMIVIRTPWDYVTESCYAGINKDILTIIRTQYVTRGTKYFGLGNFNKMKQLNDGGRLIANMVDSDPYLKDKGIRVWTGDTMTAASVYAQIMAIPNLEKLFYIGASGKIGTAVCQLLLRRKPHLKICVYSKYESFTHPNVTYTSDLSAMKGYKHVVIGKYLKTATYQSVLKASHLTTQYLLDYTVSFMPLLSQGA